jgi:hypothetical protein
MALATRARFANRYWMVWPKGFKESCKICHDFIDHFVRLALSKELREKELERGKSERKEKYVFLEALAAETRKLSVRGVFPPLVALGNRTYLMMQY